MTDPKVTATERRVIALVGCGSQKLGHAAPARELYTGRLFRAARAWAERFAAEWAVLSAKRFLVPPDRVLEPYDLRFPTNPDLVRQWCGHVRHETVWRWCRGALRHSSPTPDGLAGPLVFDYASPAFPRIVVLAGREYCRAFDGVSGFDREPLPIETPLDGLGIGERYAWLRRELGALPAGDPEPEEVLDAA